MSAILWWHKRQCSRLRLSGIVDAMAAASGGTVVPFKTAEQLEVVVAVNRRPSVLELVFSTSSQDTIGITGTASSSPFY